MQAQGVRACPLEEGNDKTLIEPRHHPPHAPRHWNREWYLRTQEDSVTGPVECPTGEPRSDWNDFQTYRPPFEDSGDSCLKQPLFLPGEAERSDFQCHIQLPKYSFPARV